MSLLKPEFSWVKVSMRPAETRLSPPMVPTQSRRCACRAPAKARRDAPGSIRGRAKDFPLAVLVQASPFSVPAQMRLPSTSTQKTWLSGRPLAVVKFSQRKRGMSCAER